MQRLEKKSVVVGLGLVGLVASQASADVLFDSHGFEPSQTNAAINYLSNTALVGQPPSADVRDQWSGVVNVGVPATNNNSPLAGVFPYGGAGTNTQYALLQAVNNTPGSVGYFFPKTNTAVVSGGRGNVTPTNPLPAVAITFSMNVYSGYSAGPANDELFGVTAFEGGGNELTTLGLNNRTGAYASLPTGATVINSSPSGLGAAGLGSFRGFELLLNYNTQQWSILSQLVPGVGAYTLDAFGPFATASATFSDADLAAFNLGSGLGSGYAAFDDYLVQTIAVPEPTSLAAGAVAFGLLAKRRRVTV